MAHETSSLSKLTGDDGEEGVGFEDGVVHWWVWGQGTWGTRELFPPVDGMVKSSKRLPSLSTYSLNLLPPPTTQLLTSDPLAWRASGSMPNTWVC